jgi:hypothetical protein
LTVSPGQETSRPFTGTVQKHMPTPTQTATPHTTGPLGLIRKLRDSYHPLKKLTLTEKVWFIYLDKSDSFVWIGYLDKFTITR